MYDTRTEAREFVGATQDEAVAKACAYFGTDASGLRVRLPETGEVYGLAARVVVVAMPAGVPVRRGGPPAGGRREEGPRRERGPRESREGGREPRRDGGREGRRDRESARPVREPERQVAEEPDAGPSTGTARTPLTETGSFVLGVIERLGLGAFDVSQATDGDLIVMQLRGPAAARLASGDGRALDAIQFLANQVAMRLDENARRIVVDVEGDGEGREGHLERLAQRAAQRARETGRSVALDPMNPRDRRVIHVAVREMDGVATMSIGTGRYRQVVVVPEGAPEYEQARLQAESGSHGNG